MTLVLSIPPGKIRKSLVFGCFQGVQEETSGMKWVNDVIFSICPELVFSNWLIVFYVWKPSKLLEMVEKVSPEKV